MIAEHNLGKVEGFPHDFQVSVVSTTENYFDLMRTLFDFEDLKSFVNRADFKLIFDGMHGVSGPYATEIFTQIFGLSSD